MDRLAGKHNAPFLRCDRRLDTLPVVVQDDAIMIEKPPYSSGSDNKKGRHTVPACIRKEYRHVRESTRPTTDSKTRQDRCMPPWSSNLRYEMGEPGSSEVYAFQQFAGNASSQIRIDLIFVIIAAQAMAPERTSISIA